MKYKRKLLLTAVVLSLAVTPFLFYLKFYYPSNQDTVLHRLRISLFDENYISVHGDGVKINDDKITVVWSSQFVKNKIIWKNGKQVDEIDNEYGPQGFTVYYYGELVGSVGHMKTNNWHTHSYKIKLHYLDSSHTIGFDFSADGPNHYRLCDIYK